MKGSPLEASGRSIASFLLGCIVLAFVTFVCVRLHTRLAIVALLYLLAIVVISLQGRFFVTLLCSVLALLGLGYFFMPPVFSLAVTRSEDIAALFTFSTTALIVTALGSKVRKSYWELAQENTERKRAEEDLRRSQAYLAEAERLSKSGSWALKPATKEITYWSPERYHLFGFDPEAGIPSYEALLERIHPEDRTRWLENTEEAERRDSDLDFRVVLPDGEIKHLHGVGHPVFSESGELVEIIGAVMDITERKRAERELHEKEVSLREAQSSLARVSRLTTMGELAVSIAHEVNQPLTAIINNANACLGLMPSETVDLDELRQALSDIVSDADRASAVIARIRGLVEKGPQKTGLNINETIGEVLTLVCGELNRHGVILQRRLANDLPPIMGDRLQLQQVILNLIINAIEAMSGVTDRPRELLVSSEISGDCPQSPSLPGLADARQQKNPVASRAPNAERQTPIAERTHILVSVVDSGSGLNLNNLDQIFNAFYTTKPQGLGMGLSISRSIVTAHGGRLWAMTNLPKGALFQFTLPIGAE
jgi:PAS domain S-box-containing protein